MAPDPMELVNRELNKVNQKVLVDARYESWLDGRAEGREEVLARGKAEAKEKVTKEIAKNLRNSVDLEELSKATGLTVEEIKKL